MQSFKQCGQRQPSHKRLSLDNIFAVGRDAVMIRALLLSCSEAPCFKVKRENDRETHP